MIAQFLITDTSGKTRNFKLENGEYVLIGRSPKGCQVVIDDDLSSSVHAKLQLDKSEVIVEDLTSKNGTYVNGLKILKQRIYLEDKILIGDSALVFNLTKMDAATKRALKHSDPNSRYDGSLTLELETALNYKPNIMASQNNAASKRSSSADPESNNYVKESKIYQGVTESKEELEKHDEKNFQYLFFSKFATILDLALSLSIGIVVFMTSFFFEPKIAYKAFSDANIEKNGYMDIVFSDEMILYTICAIIFAFISRVINNRLPNGTFAERILKLN